MPRPSIARRIPWLIAVTVLAASGCAHRPVTSSEARRWTQAQQLVLVTSADWNTDHGTLRRFERDGAGWRIVGDAQPVTIGRAGSAWGLGLNDARDDGPVKREGDGRSPAVAKKLAGSPALFAILASRRRSGRSPTRAGSLRSRLSTWQVRWMVSSI